jgi:hypothetical protein
MTSHHSNTPVLQFPIPVAFDHRDSGLLEGRCYENRSWEKHYDPRNFA